ncbi:Osmoprotectant ABC transporter binding protein YehZ [Klebsiella michiganensis]|nr:Osmoprotectant ABC transporter binding protein YehZ [Klebsiella michiganensis]
MIKASMWSGTLALAALISLPLQAAEPVKVGSKIDTEGALLGNIILQVLESHGVKTVNKIQLGTTPVVRGAITAGELDIYPEYTGTARSSSKRRTTRRGKTRSRDMKKLKSWMRKRISSSGLPRLRPTTPGLSPSVRIWRRKTTSPH